MADTVDGGSGLAHTHYSPDPQGRRAVPGGRHGLLDHLEFVISHPAVPCATPATSRVDHMEENMGALYGRLPEPALRDRMARYLAQT